MPIHSHLSERNPQKVIQEVRRQLKMEKGVRYLSIVATGSIFTRILIFFYFIMLDCADFWCAGRGACCRKISYLHAWLEPICSLEGNIFCSFLFTKACST